MKTILGLAFVVVIMGGWAFFESIEVPGTPHTPDSNPDNNNWDRINNVNLGNLPPGTVRTPYHEPLKAKFGRTPITRIPDFEYEYDRNKVDENGDLIPIYPKRDLHNHPSFNLYNGKWSLSPVIR